MSISSSSSMAVQAHGPSLAESSRSTTHSESDPWTAAFASLSTDDRSQLNHREADRRSLMQDLSDILNQKQKLCLEKRWKFINKKGQVIIVRDLFEKISCYVKKFVEVVDVAVQYDPVHAALPWAAVRFLLQLVINATDLHASMVEGLEKVSGVITRYAIVENLYVSRLSASKPLLQQHISKLYLAILQCLAKFSSYFNQTTAGMLFKSPLKNVDREMLPYISNIDRRDEEIQILLQLYDREDQMTLLGSSEKTSSQIELISQSIQDIHLHMSQGRIAAGDRDTRLLAITDKRLDGVQAALIKIKDDLQRPLQRLSFQMHHMEDRLTNKQRIEILRWLSTVACRKHHANMSGDLLPGSCIWLARHPVFQQWSNSSVSSVLWLHGIPGSGKSKLVAHTIELFLKQAQSEPTAAPVAFFYCIRATAERERANPEEIMRAILKQLAKAKSDLPLRSSIVAKFEHARQESLEDGSELSSLTIDDCVSLILEILENTSATIIIDALDECDPVRRHELLRALKVIVAEAENLVRVFISSRDHTDIVIKLTDVPNIYISSSDNYKDIEQFVTVKIDEAIGDQRLLSGNISQTVRDEIISVLVEKAKGMFLWVSLQIQTICDFERIQIVEDLQDELNKVPENLQQLYDGAMKRIDDKGMRARASAIKTLHWILFAEQPLSVEALVQAVNEVTATSLNSTDIVSICNNLVVLDKESNVFRFAHLSVREYLESREDFSQGAVHQEIALQCLRSCFTSLKRDTFHVEGFDGSHYMHYTLLYWPVHCYYARNELDLSLIDALSSSILDDQNDNTPMFAAWLKIVSSMKTKLISDKWRAWFKLASSRPPDPIFLVITFDLKPFLRRLPRTIHDGSNHRNAFNLSPLALACYLGRSHTVEALLASGASINLENEVTINRYGPWYSNPLSAAIAGKHTSLVTTLLYAGALVNIEPGPGNHLRLAVRTGDQRLVQALIESIQKTTRQPDSVYLNYPLDTAAGDGNEEMCRFLLGQGALPNNPNDYDHAQPLQIKIGSGRSGPLESAAQNGHLRVVRLLIENQACIDNSATDDWGSALARAAFNGHSSIVEYLIQMGADPNLETGPYGSPFLSAVASGIDVVVRLMLAHGAEIHTSGKENGPALAIAIHYGFSALILLLIDQGADIQQPFTYHSRHFDNALEFIAYAGTLEMLQQTINHVKRTVTRSDMGGLLTAAILGHRPPRRQIITWLLEAGADANTQDVTALHVAARDLEIDPIHQLLSYGAHINAMSDTMGSVLQAIFLPSNSFLSEKAWRMDYFLPQTFVFLVEAGSDINAVGGELGDAIQAAASYGRHEEVKQLLNLGAKIQTRIGKYGSGLHAAASCGHSLCCIPLLNSDIDINTVCEPYGSSLQAASSRGRMPASKYLESDPQLFHDKLYFELVNSTWYPIQADRYRETFDTLIKAGASVHSVGGRFGTVLQAAAYVGDDKHVEVLLRAGADVQVKGGFYGHCLQAVAAGEAEEWWTSRGYYPISEDSVVFPEHDDQPLAVLDSHAITMERLLAAGAHAYVNEEGGFFSTCLQAAAHSDNSTLVEMLLRSGATVVEDGKGFYGGCISAAIGFGKERLTRSSPEDFQSNSDQILRLLLEHTPPIDFQQLYSRAFRRAVQNRNNRGAKLLNEVALAVATERNITINLSI